jgi:hypothetical protein
MTHNPGFRQLHFDKVVRQMEEHADLLRDFATPAWLCTGRPAWLSFKRRSVFSTY